MLYHWRPMTSNAITGDTRRSETTSAGPARIRVTTVGARASAVAVLGAVYLLQAVTPLRLDNDAVVYLRMATSFADGIPMDRTGLPPGYPALVAFLDSLGLGFPFVFVLVNMAFIAAGLAAAHYLFDASASGRPSWVVPLTMVSVVVVRYLPMPLPESMFFGMSLTAVALMTAGTRSIGARRGWLLCGALALTIAAIMVRLVGVALLPALIWSCLNGGAWGTSTRPALTRRDKLTVAAALVGAALVATFALGDSLDKYSYEAQLMYSQIEGLRPVWVHGRNLLWTLGEVVLNLPWAQFRPYRVVFFWAGFASVVWLLISVRFRRPATPAGVYLVSFIILLALWPYTALRLWLPIVPLLIGFAESATLRFNAGRKWTLFTRVYLAWFVFAGVAAIAYTSRITFSGSNFPRVYGKAGGMSFPDPVTGRVDTLHNQRARVLLDRFVNPF